jgi:F-type H+-transporting ATPase subunit a
VRLLASSSEIDVQHPTWGKGFLAINYDTIFNTLIVCGILIVLALVLRANTREGRPTRIQSIIEAIIEFLHGLIKDTLGRKPIRIGPIAISLFIFLLVANWLGLVPVFKSPTNDVNTTTGLALFSIGLLHYYSVKFRRPGGYVKHYFSVVTPKLLPIGWLIRGLFAMLEFIQELSRPVTLSFRLYFNIFVGELMVALIISLFPAFIAPFPGVVWLLFSLFVGAVQAFIFTMLTIAYIAMGTEVSHAEHEEGEGHHPEGARETMPSLGQSAAEGSPAY